MKIVLLLTSVLCCGVCSAMNEKSMEIVQGDIIQIGAQNDTRMESAQGSIDEQNSMEVLKKKYIRSLCEMTARIRSFVLDRSWQTEKWDGIDRMRKEIEEDSEKFDARVVRSERMAGTRENRLKELDKIWNLAYEMYTSLKTAMVRVEGYGDSKWLFTVGE